MQIQHGWVRRASTNKTKSRKLYNQQKYALRIKLSKNKVDSVSYLLKEVKTLNIFKIIIFQTLIFRFKTKDQLNFTNFSHKFQSIAH